MNRERFAPTIEPHLASHGQAMRVILAERMIHQKRQEIQKLAQQLAQKTRVFSATSSGAKKATAGQDEHPLALEGIDPTGVWVLYEQGNTRFHELTERWESHLSTINGLEQLFLIS